MLERIVITALIVFAIHATMWEGMIFGVVNRWFQNVRDSITKPLFSCPICMSPYYGSALYWLIWANNWQEWLIVIIGAMGLNAVIVKLTE